MCARERVCVYACSRARGAFAVVNAVICVSSLGLVMSRSCKQLARKGLTPARVPRFLLAPPAFCLQGLGQLPSGCSVRTERERERGERERERGREGGRVRRRRKGEERKEEEWKRKRDGVR